MVMEAFLKEHHFPVKNYYWIDLVMVGTGSLCYVTSHGMSMLSSYHPHPKMVELAEQAAKKQPALSVTG